MSVSCKAQSQTLFKTPTPFDYTISLASATIVARLLLCMNDLVKWIIKFIS